MLVRKLRVLLLAAAAFVLLLAALFTAAGVGVRPARAADPPLLSDGCRFLNHLPSIPAESLRMLPPPHIVGEVITVTASGSATTIGLAVDGVLVAQTPVPGTLSYTIPASGSYAFMFITDRPMFVTWSFSCSAPDLPHPWFFTQPAADAGVLAEVQALPFDGRQACGAFTADWWGIKYLLAENFPGCADYLPDHVEVACLNEHAEWTTDYVKSAQVSGGVFGATLYQHGTCALFPAP